MEQINIPAEYTAIYMYFVINVIDIHFSLFSWECWMVVYAVNGYCRGEGILAVYIQKKEAANRIHATWVHSLTSADGYKEHGILFIFLLFWNFVVAKKSSTV